MKILSREERKALSPEAKKQYMAELNAFIETEKKKLEEVIELIKNASDYDEYELVRGEDQTKLSLWINEEWKTINISHEVLETKTSDEFVQSLNL